jgi:hypothetical protein
VSPNKALQRTGLALRARPSLASLSAGERGRWSAQLNISRIAVAVVLGLGLVVAVHASDTRPMTLMLGGLEYQHRWSQRGQHEFTPKGQDDLAQWQDMVTINVHEAVGTDDQLKELATRVLGNFKRGKILRAASGARSEKEPTEYFVAALLGASAFSEAAFARIVLIDGTGFVLVQSRRAYGTDAALRVGEWVQNNGTSVEKSLLAWSGIPSLASLKELPETK